MSAKISAQFRKVAADGRIGKSDVEKVVKEALDGKGITRVEANKLKELREKYADQFTSKGADAIDNFLARMNRSWSRTKRVHLPNVEQSKVKELLQSDPRISIYTGGGEYGGRVGGSESSSGGRVGGSESGGSRYSGSEYSGGSHRYGGGE